MAKHTDTTHKHTHPDRRRCECCQVLFLTPDGRNPPVPSEVSEARTARRGNSPKKVTYAHSVRAQNILGAFLTLTSYLHEGEKGGGASNTDTLLCGIPPFAFNGEFSPLVLADKRETAKPKAIAIYAEKQSHLA